ncbi:hypothetical protein PsorP6_006435 [Peronosclerospora sorghi]|uniref:Uncharacterized protein n=1 Tax=Peronosclerospora sorghi TaxID=230839 RepID=A0ACC0W4K0_9STRA|nr:hypothetical protein PsorP6_006435 [Peronosclerospora sorghi]
MKALHQRKEREMGKGFLQLKDNVENIGKEVVKFSTKLKHCKTSIEKQVNAEVGINEQQAENEQATVDEIEATYTEKEKEANDYQRQIQDLNVGMDQSGDTNDVKAARIAESNTTIKQINLKLKLTEERTKSKRREIDQTRNNNRSLEEERKYKIDELENMHLQVDQFKTNFKPEEERKLHDRVRELQDMISRAEREVDENLSGLSSRLDFKYTDPYRNFDRNCVKGVLINLLETNHEWYALSLEIAAVRARVTIIPLNRISRKTVDRRKIDKARQVARQQGGKIWEEMELIHFKPDVLPAIEYVFGSFIIYETGELAKNVTFHRDIKVKTVTLDGDQFIVMRWRELLCTIRLFKHSTKLRYTFPNSQYGIHIVGKGKEDETVKYKADSIDEETEDYDG